MAHFVPIPPDREFWVPKLQQLSLFDKNGTAAIAVWGMPDGSEVRAEANDVFVAEEYRKTADLRFFYLRGLKAGDKIAAFITTPSAAQFTGWLPIKFVAGDHWSKQRTNGTLPKSKFMPNFTLDPHGSEQRHPPVPENTWLRTVDETIVKIRANAIGSQVLGGIIKAITIGAYIPRDQNANSAIIFTPQTWQGSTAPGSTADEVLFHELVHVLEDDFDQYVDNPLDGLKFDGSDFLTVTATNLYASLVGRPLRADHLGFNPLPTNYQTNAASFRAAHAGNFASIKRRLPAYFRVFASSAAPWNPFK